MLMYLKVFLVGGTICLIAQILLDRTAITSSKILVLYVAAGVIISAFGLYQPLMEFAGAGATVPLTGFGHSLAQGAKAGVAENGLQGAITGGLSATAGGITVAICFGYLNALIFNPKTKG